MVTINKQWIIKQLFFMAQLPINSHIIQITRGKKKKKQLFLYIEIKSSN